MSTDEKIIKQLTTRIERLEREVFGSGKKTAKKNAGSNFKGATGGVRLLISKEFFTGKKTFGEVRKALEDNGYHYSAQAVQMAVSALSERNGPLISLKKEGKKFYAIRK